MSVHKLTLSALMICAVAMPSAATANSIGEVENARAKERSGYYVTRQDREQLRRHGGNDSYGSYGYDDGYDDRSYYNGGAAIYVGPRHDGAYDD